MKTMDDVFYKKFFSLAALWNIAIGVTGVLFYDFCVTLFFNKNVIVHNMLTILFFKIFMIAIITYGVGYYIVSRNLSLNRGIIWLGLISKMILFSIFTYFFIVDIATWIAFTALSGDFIWSVFFIIFLVQTKAEVQTNNIVG